MPREDAFEVEGVVVARISDRSVRVELPNGHRLVGHARGVRGRLGPGAEPGRTVRVQVSVCDLSKGLVVSETTI